MTTPTGPQARQYAADAVTRDGLSIRLRAIRPDDKQRIIDLVSRMGPDSVYFRFFRTARKLSDEELRSFTELDFERQVALVATLTRGAGEEVIGVGRFAMMDGAGDRAEIAFAVADAYQNRGIGTLLLEHLTAIARANGITKFEADVLGENNRMLRMFATSGFAVERSFESGVFHVTFPIQPTAQSRAASLEREMAAAAASVRSFLHPRSVAVIGASRSPGKIGSAILANLLRDGFRGPVYPINPGAAEIQGRRAYPRVGAIGSPVDLAIVAVPAPAVEEALRDCIDAGVRGVVVISAGFAESKAAGREAERRLIDLARASGLRLVGPNCMGLLNTDPEVCLNATFAPSRPPAGNIAMSSQSGALGIAILGHLERIDLGVASFVSVGNKADVSGNDLLAYWADDPRTEVIVLYLESFGNPRRFARIAPLVARRKPIVAVKSGRSAAGIKAASSHSASLASLDVAVDALFEEAGVIRTNTMEELFDVAALLALQPVPRGPRVGVITNAGGPGILAADACEARGLKLSELSAETVSRLREVLPPEASLSNPVDMIAAATPAQFEATLEAVGSDPNVDSVLALYIPVMEARTEEVARAIAIAAEKVPAYKPVLTVFLSHQGTPAALASGPRGRLPTFSFPENAAMALAAAERYGRWRVRPAGEVLELDPFARSAVRAVVDRVLETVASGTSVWVEPLDLAAILRAAGIEFAVGESIPPDPATAVSVGEKLGYPLVAKAEAAGLLHKSEVGGVILGIRTPDEAAAAVTQLAERLRRADMKLERVFLQREVKGGVEALVGITTDPTFGPLVVCGLGGVLVELLKDVAFHLTPLSDIGAREMVAKLRSRKLLDGYRGAPPGDVEAFVQLIRRVAALVEVVPEIAELDLNPVKVLPPGSGAVAVDGRMRLTGR